MFDSGVNIQEFEIVQTSPISFKVTVKELNLLQNQEKKTRSFQKLQELLTTVFSEDITISFDVVESFPPQTQRKKRPIRRSF